jgi:hypothetical protein
VERKGIYSVLPLIVLAGISCETAWAGTVALGWDYLQTVPVTSFDFTVLSGGAVGVVNFMGNPVGPGNTDTIIQRLADATINAGSAPTGLTAAQIALLPNAIPIQITELSLESTAPVDIAGSFFDVFVTLDPTNLANDKGTMSIYGSTAGGTFDSQFDVFFEVQFENTSNPAANLNIFDSAVLTPIGTATWAPTQPSSCIPTTEGDPADILHHSVCSATGPVPSQDFYLTGTTPEPASIWLMGAGLLGMGTFMRRRRRVSSPRAFRSTATHT